MTVFDNSVAQRLVKARSAHEWSQQELSEVSGVAAAQISRYEAGRSKPRPEVLAKLAKALGVQFEWLSRGAGPIEEESKTFPSNRNVYQIELTDEQAAELERFAKSMGVTSQMALRAAIFQSVVPKDDRMTEIERLGKELLQRIEAIEGAADSPHFRKRKS